MRSERESLKEQERVRVEECEYSVVVVARKGGEGGEREGGWKLGEV